MNLVNSEKDLRQLIPAYPKILDKRIIKELDTYCFEIIEHSSLVIFGCSDKSYPIDILHHSKLKIIDSQTLQIELKGPNFPGNVFSESQPILCSLYFLIPGIGHGLRVNGRLVINKHSSRLVIHEVFTHCARAIARSEFWRAKNSNPLKLLNPSRIIKESPYLLLKTMNEDFKTELSPRGDQTGFVQMISPDRLFIPERPGNKVAISLRNIIQNPSVELLMFIPGSTTIMRVKAHASITTDKALLEGSTVNNKQALLGILLEDCAFEVFKENPALIEAQPWLTENQLEAHQITRFPKVLSAHMNGEGLLGRMTTPIVSSIVKKDLNNLY